jgi:LmbE family N-acetylglucosaminyl deacetylase
MEHWQFPIRKGGIFRPGKEIEGLRGGVHLYAAQASPKIDATRAEKDPFRTETSLAWPGLARLQKWEEFDVVQVLFMVLFAFVTLAPACALAEKPKAIEPLISKDTRLMVFSPHPDDESLGAAGLIQRVIKTGGGVKVVFLTNGDGFPEAVEMGDHISNPTARDFREYGEDRMWESHKALGTLGMKESDVIFLRFPDGGLTALRSKTGGKEKAYTSPTTKENRPSALAVVVPQTGYTAEGLQMAIERVLSDYRPNMLATSAPEDTHPDHASTYFFVKQAWKHLHKEHREFKPTWLIYLIHYGQWPMAQGLGIGSKLNPPEDYPHQEKWIPLVLTSEEAATKRKALLEYQTQMIVMGRYLLSFARSNELFRLDDK